MNNFYRKALTIRFELAEGSFTGNPEDNWIEISGLRIDATIVTTAGGYFNAAQIVVFGLKPDTMNALTLLGPFGQPKQNKVSLYTYDGNGSEILVFSGMIFSALADYNSMPNVPFHICARSLYRMQLTVPQSLSFKGAVPVQNIVQTILNNYNSTVRDSEKLTLEVAGDIGVLTDFSLTDSYAQMLYQVAKAADVLLNFEGQTVIIAQRGVIRKIDPISIDMTNGLIGYPALIPNGAIIRAVYSPYYRWLAPIVITSVQVLQQRGSGQPVGTLSSTYTISAMTHRLQSEMPGGLWQSEMKLYLMQGT